MDYLRYDIRWTDELDEEYIFDFLYVQNSVFMNGSREEFARQFERNIYGRSIIVVVYFEGQPIAARALWRNDVDGREAYQAGSSCVLPHFRGYRIFTEMTSRAIAMLPDDVLVYNFPNRNSFPACSKMGWDMVRQYKFRLYLSYDSFHDEHPVPLDSRYAQWWMEGRKLYHTNIGGHYFIIKRDWRPFCYHILAETDKSVAEEFPVRLGLFFYMSSKITWYNKRFGITRLMSVNQGESVVPTWKIDCI